MAKMECILCNMEFNKTDFKKHQLIHSATSFKCDHCDMAFKHLKHRDNHMENKHETKTGNDWDERSNVTKKLDFDEDRNLTKTPKKEAKTPKKEEKTPKRETKTPKRETKTPRRETKETKEETKTPKKDTKTPKNFKNLKVDNCIGCKKSFSDVETLMMHMKTSHECRMKQKSSDDYKWVTKNSDSLKGHGDTFYPTEERRTSFENIFPKTSFGSNKPKKIAYVKPQIKEVSEDVGDNNLKKKNDCNKRVENNQVELNIPLLQQDQALDEDKFKCDNCGDKFEDMWEIKEHFLSKHNSEEMYHDFRRKKKQKTKMLMQQARLVKNPEASQNPSGELLDNVSPSAKSTERTSVTFPCEFCDERFQNLKSLKKQTVSNHEQTNEDAQEQLKEDGAAMNRSMADSSMASSDGSFWDTSDIIQNTKPSRTRKSSCQKCTACKAEDCGVCVYCKDKPKFGGPSKMKQKCLRRICLEGNITQQKRKMLKMLEKELEMSIESKKKKKSESGSSAKNDEVNDSNEEKSKAEKEGKSPGIKLKIKLKSSKSKADCSDKWASEIISSQENAETTSPKKRANEGGTVLNESKHKKIKRETKAVMEVDESSDAIPNCTQEELDKLIKSEVQDMLEMPNNMDTEVSVKSKSTTRDEVVKLIKSEVEEILEMQRSFSEDLKNLIKIDGGSLDIENELSVPILPPKTPKKYLENTIEKLTNRIVKDSLNLSEKNDLAEEKVLDMLLQDTPSCSDSPNKTTIEELEVPGRVETNQDLDKLGFVIGDITKPNDDGTIITLFPSAPSAVKDLDPELEKFEKLKLISPRLFTGELSLGSASSLTGLGLPVLRCWLESLQQMLG